jgi:uncharacterized protein YktB (UPF0637 family)
VRLGEASNVVEYPLRIIGEGLVEIDNERTRRLNEAVQKYTKSAMESYETVWDHFARAQESQGQLTQGLFEEAIAHLRTQAERNLHASEELAEQGRRGQEASRVLAQGSADAYAQFVDSLFLYYRESARLSERETKEE